MKLPPGAEAVDFIAFSFPPETAVRDIALFKERATVYLSVNGRDTWNREFRDGMMTPDLLGPIDNPLPYEGAGEIHSGGIAFIFFPSQPATGDDDVTVRLEMEQWTPHTPSGLKITATLCIAGKNAAGEPVREWIN